MSGCWNIITAFLGIAMIAATSYYLAGVGIAESKVGTEHTDDDMKKIYLSYRHINTLTDSLIFYTLSGGFLMIGAAIQRKLYLDFKQFYYKKSF
jgi:hypothetical protein